jgi:hypothetical protein
LSNTNGDLFYFKESYNNNEGKFYKYEFYSEVIASFLGKMLDLDVLEYKIAVFEKRIGCLSKNMIDKDEELIEGGKYLKAFDPTFIAEKENPKSKYTYQLIQKAILSYFEQTTIAKIHDVIIFDSIIGNSDRHQENWGFIAKHNFVSKAFSKTEAIYENPSDYDAEINIFETVLKFFRKKSINLNDIKSEKLNLIRDIRFSPIYDSGCCLGREMDEEKIQRILHSEEMFHAYVNRGKSEIHWESQKINHFQLLKSLINEDHNLKTKIKNLIDKINIEKLKKFVDEIDHDIPQAFEEYKISKERKEFIVKLVTLRVENIKKIVLE